MAGLNEAIRRRLDRYKSRPERKEEEKRRRRLHAVLARSFFALQEEAEVRQRYPELTGLLEELSGSLDGGDPDEVEGRLAAIYILLHGKSMEYAPSERREMDRWGGYWCHAGGFAPFLHAAPYLHAETRFADYGAGNGLQGLLFQRLYPHAKTTQIELSGPMIEEGKSLQQWMGIPEEKVEWIHGNILEVPPDRFDFIYLYLPLRAKGPGKLFYERFARSLAESDHPVTIFSIADCLKDFLDESFEIFFDDGQLTCFRRAVL